MEAREALLLKAATDVARQREAGVRETIKAMESRFAELVEAKIVAEKARPNIVVKNDVQTPEIVVQIDMSPIAEALGRIVDLLEELRERRKPASFRIEVDDLGGKRIVQE